MKYVQEKKIYFRLIYSLNFAINIMNDKWKAIFTSILQHGLQTLFVDYFEKRQINNLMNINIDIAVSRTIITNAELIKLVISTYNNFIYGIPNFESIDKRRYLALIHILNEEEYSLIFIILSEFLAIQLPEENKY